MNRLCHPTSALLAFCLFQACTDDDADSNASAVVQQTAGTRAPADSPAEPKPTGDDAFAGCTRGTLEPDLQAAPLSGAGVTDGALAPGQYLISSTYLQLKPDTDARFQELLGPIQSDLASREGLVALSLGGSPACGTARTLAVWRDDVSMFAFASGEAHSAAARSVSEVSRGGSVVTHFSGDASAATWEVAAQHLAADDGPQY